MVTEKVFNISKVWYRFTKTTKNGMKLKFRWEQLPEHRFEEFVDFKMNYFVKHELTHVVAGIYKNPEAMDEYRQIVSKLYKEPSYYTSVCCVDDEKSEIVGFDSLKLYRKGEIYKDNMPAQTAEVKTFYRILHEWNNLCPIPDLLVKYGVNTFLDDAGFAIHPDYRGYRFSTESPLLRHTVSKANSVPLTGAWLTSAAVQKAAEQDGWETVYDVSSDKLQNILGVKFQNAPPFFVYKVKRIE